MYHVINNVLMGLNRVGGVFYDYAAGVFIQLALLVILLFAIDLLLRKKVRAVFRYCVWLLVLAKLILPPMLSLPTGIGYWVGDHIPVVPGASNMAFDAVALEHAGPSGEMPHVRLSENIAGDDSAMASAETALTPLTWQAVLFLLWLAGVLAFLAVLVQRIRFVKGLVAASCPAGDELTGLLEQCRRQMAVRRDIKLRLSEAIPSPAVCGLLRPTVLIPTSLVEKLSPEGLRATLIHELAHIKRGDLWINSVQTFLQVVYFYNPFVWFANSIIRKVCEEAVDETVLVALGGQAKDYSNTLIDIGEVVFWKADLGLRLIGVAESKKALQWRIRHMLNRPIPKSAKVGMFGVTVIFAIAAVLLPMAKAQKPEAAIEPAISENERKPTNSRQRTADTGPTHLGPIVNSSVQEWTPHISADDLSLYFLSSGRPGGLGGNDIWVTTRKTKEDPWGAPVNVGPPINSVVDDGCPCTSYDGLDLYFSSGRPGGSGDGDIWVATRKTKDDPWGTPINLGPRVNSPAGDAHPSVSTDGLFLYFTSGRPGGSGRGDIWVTTRKTKEDPWGTPVNLGPTVNSQVIDEDPDISVDGLSLYFNSGRSPRLGSGDIWVTTRKTKEDPWDTPVNLGPTVNSPYDEYDVDVSSDGSTLYFITDLAGSVDWSYDIWQVALEKSTQGSSLQAAAFAGDLARVKAFLDKGVDVNQRKARGVTALYSAVSGGHKEVVEFLLTHGADVNKRTRPRRIGLTALHAAAREGHKEIVEVLLAAGAALNVNAGNYYWRHTAAETAMDRNHNEIVRLLIAKGADISALHFAIHMKDYAKAKSLIENGANVNQRTPTLDTLLHFAVAGDQENMAELLIAKGADMNIQAPRKGQTPLHLSAREGNAGMVELLVAKGTDINAKNNREETPLHIAVIRNHKTVVELLLAAGADTTMKDREGRTPLAWAETRGDTEIVDLLKKHGAKE